MTRSTAPDPAPSSMRPESAGPGFGRLDPDRRAPSHVVDSLNEAALSQPPALGLSEQDTLAVDLAGDVCPNGVPLERRFRVNERPTLRFDGTRSSLSSSCAMIERVRLCERGLVCARFE